MKSLDFNPASTVTSSITSVKPLQVILMVFLTPIEAFLVDLPGLQGDWPDHHNHQSLS